MTATESINHLIDGVLQEANTSEDVGQLRYMIGEIAELTRGLNSDIDAMAKRLTDASERSDMLEIALRKTRWEYLKAQKALVAYQHTPAANSDDVELIAANRAGEKLLAELAELKNGMANRIDRWAATVRSWKWEVLS